MRYNVEIRRDDGLWYTVAVFNMLHEAIDYARIATEMEGVYHLVTVDDGGKH